MELISYSQARKLATSNKGKTFTFDSGDGWTSTVVWDFFTKRLLFTSYNPNGEMV